MYKRRPVYGANISAILPFQLTLLWEGTLKDESMHAVAEDGQYRVYRKASSSTSGTGDVFVNSDVRLEWGSTFEQEHQIRLAGEYLYNGEGLSTEMYDRSKSFLDQSDAADREKYYSGAAGVTPLFDALMFRHYVYGSIGYDNTAVRAGVNYQCVWAPLQGTTEHRLSISKSYDSVSISLAGIFSVSNEKYRLINHYEDIILYAGVTVTM